MWGSRLRRKQILSHIDRVVKSPVDTTVILQREDIILINDISRCVYCGHHNPDNIHVMKCRNIHNTSQSKQHQNISPIPPIEYIKTTPNRITVNPDSILSKSRNHVMM